MILKISIIAFIICTLESNCVDLDEIYTNDKYILEDNGYILEDSGYVLEDNGYVLEDDGVTQRIIYSKGLQLNKWAAKGVFNKTYLKIGWDTVDIETNPAISDEDQAFSAGYLEGLHTHSAIYDYYNNVKPYQSDQTTQIYKYFMTNKRWLDKMIKIHADSDIYWKQVKLFYLQMKGIYKGYNKGAAPDRKLKLMDIMWLNYIGDIFDLEDKFPNANKNVGKIGHCSGLVKLLPDQSDIFVSHNSWNLYKTMNRMIKRYTLHYKDVKATSSSFSGYPGTLGSIDDFIITNSGLILQETTNNVKNGSLYSLMKPLGQVLEVVRVTVANRLATDGQSWTKIFSQYNSGTYNNQWMVVDMKRFSPGSVKSGLLWIAEQMPGYVRREDKTDVLTSRGYWASYNVPYFPDVFKRMGYDDYRGSYENCPRALIFKRDQGKVKDLHSMMLLMRSNDYLHDPLSDKDPGSAIASRDDLRGGMAFGAIDAKVTSYQLSKSLSMLAVCGPTTGTNLPPFQWSKTHFTAPHYGQPDIFRFQPVLISWSSEQHTQQ